MQLHRIEPHPHRKARGLIRHRPFGRKQGELPIAPAPLVEGFDHAAPRRVLAVVDLAEIQDWSLHHTTARAALAFDNAPATVLLAVLPSSCESQVHGPRSSAERRSAKITSGSTQIRSRRTKGSTASSCCANTDLNPLEAILCYKQLWTVEQTFRTAKHLFSTRPIFHKLDETIRGHVFCSFLALVVKKLLEDRIAALGRSGSRPEIIADPDSLTETAIEQDGKRFIVRSAPRPAASVAIRAALVAPPPTVREASA
jgi:hypothetical protein